MTSMDDRPIHPAKTLPTEPAMPPADSRPRHGIPAPIRVDRLQLEEALKPVVQAVADLNATFRQCIPIVEEFGRQVGVIVEFAREERMKMARRGHVDTPLKRG